MSYTPEQLREVIKSISMMTIDEVIRAHAAALEENAKLKKHAEAMADAISGWILKTREREDLADAAASYRADFPKEPR